MSTPSQNYILQRGTDSHACMVVMRDHPTEPWEWDEKSADDFKDIYDAVIALAAADSDESADTSQARGLRDVDLDGVRDMMRGYLSLAKRKYRNDATKMRLLKPLVVKSEGILRTLKLALDVESAWKQIDQAYVPKAGVTFAAFATLRGACQTKFENVAKEGAEEGQASGELSKGLRDLYRLSVDWYQEAFRRFGPETPHGMMIREQIDTGSGTPPPPLPGQAVITSIIYDNGPRLEFDAEDAETFDVWERILPDAEFTKVASNISEKVWAHTDLHADFEYKVVGRNSHGDGPESDVASISG
ncbi:MAG TPA: hypothetical protein VGF13_23555 [Verrucomicrobiae bacterium]|jgi:hypothetical protein